MLKVTLKNNDANEHFAAVYLESIALKYKFDNKLFSWITKTSQFQSLSKQDVNEKAHGDSNSSWYLGTLFKWLFQR